MHLVIKIGTWKPAVPNFLEKEGGIWKCFALVINLSVLEF